MELKKIIVPIDFSEPAMNALVYAHSLSKKMQALLQVVHVYRPIISQIPEDPNASRDMTSKCRDKFDDLIDQMNQSWSSNSSDYVPIDSLFRIGFAVDELKLLSDQSRENTLLIIGSSGDTGLLKKRFGSVTTGLATKLTRPLLIIPPESTYTNIKTVVYAAEKYETDIKMIPDLTNTLDHGNFTISIVHVHKNDTPYPSQRLLEELNESFPEYTFNFRDCFSEDIADAIQEHTATVGAEIVCVNHRHRGLLQNIFHKSIARKLTIFTKTPLLILSQN